MMWNFLSNYSWRLYLLSNLIKCRGLILDCNSAIRFFSRLRAIMETNRLTRIGLVNLNARTSAFLCILSHSRSKKSKIRPSWDTTRCINNSLILLCRFILRIVSPGDSTREYLSGTYVIINFSSIRTSILIYYFRTLRSWVDLNRYWLVDNDLFFIWTYILRIWIKTSLLVRIRKINILGWIRSWNISYWEGLKLWDQPWLRIYMRLHNVDIIYTNE